MKLSGCVQPDRGKPGELYHGLLDSDVAALAGNTISVPVIGGILAVIMTCCVLGRPDATSEAQWNAKFQDDTLHFIGEKTHSSSQADILPGCRVTKTVTTKAKTNQPNKRQTKRGHPCRPRL